jgi:hypothetical protein
MTGPGQDGPESRRFHLTKSRLALGGKNVANLAALLPFDLRIQVNEIPAQQQSERTADAALTGTHEPGEGDERGLGKSGH